MFNAITLNFDIDIIQLLLAILGLYKWYNTTDPVNYPTVIYQEEIVDNTEQCSINETEEIVDNEFGGMGGLILGAMMINRQL